MTAASPVLVITGPTASGKGAVAHRLALIAGGEIVSMDSMKVYRELDIGTAKPSAELRNEVPYHLIDLVDPHVDFSVADYLGLLDRVLDEIRGRGRLPILCGGTALYLKAWLEGFREGPPADWNLRERLIEEAEREGPETLHRRLEGVDPEAARKVHPRDVRRIVRALEVIERTGSAISAGWRWGAAGRGGPCARVFGLRWDRPALHGRIDRRVLLMVGRGLIEEAARLRRRDPPLGRTASQAIGYKEVWRGLDDGRAEEEIVERVQRSTRRFAKQQMTWFRKLPVEWLYPGPDYDPALLAGEVLRRSAE